MTALDDNRLGRLHSFEGYLTMETKNRPVKRDKQQTRARILAAVGDILLNQGFEKLGINSVAGAAGVDKVLIYRYFGDLNGLLTAYADENADSAALPPLAWPSRERLLDPAAVTSALLKNQLEELRRRPLAQATLRSEIHDENVLTQKLSPAREKLAREYLAKLPLDLDKHPELDPGTVFALIHAGISYLVVSASRLDAYQGIDLKSARGWKRIEQAIDKLVAGYFNQELGADQSHRS